MTPSTRLPGIAVLALVSTNLTYMKPKRRLWLMVLTQPLQGCWPVWLANVYLSGQREGGCTPTSISRLASLHAWEHSGAVPGQRTGEPRQTLQAPGGKCTLFIPTHDAMGRKKRTTQPNLGVREGFLEEMVFKLVSKNIWQFERRKRFQGEGTAQERERI